MQGRVAVLKAYGGEMIFNPSFDTVLRRGDRLIAVGKRENLARLEQLAAVQTQVRA